MLTVERKDTPKRTIRFEDLPIGEVYRDEEGFIAMKLNNNGQDNSLTFEWSCHEEWEVTSENLLAEVTPLKATLTVWEEEE